MPFYWLLKLFMNLWKITDFCKTTGENCLFLLSFFLSFDQLFINAETFLLYYGIFKNVFSLRSPV